MNLCQHFNASQSLSLSLWQGNYNETMPEEEVIILPRVSFSSSSSPLADDDRTGNEAISLPINHFANYAKPLNPLF